MRILPGSLVLAAALAASGVGCTPANYTAPERYERGLVVVMSGAGDIMGEVNSIRGGLDAGGVKHALEEFRWSRRGGADGPDGCGAQPADGAAAGPPHRGL